LAALEECNQLENNANSIYIIRNGAWHMNGELYQICSIAVAAKNALKNKRDIMYTPMKYENKTEFKFCKKNSFFLKRYTAKNVSAWFNYCVKKGLQDIKLLIPVEIKRRGLLGFSNAIYNSLLCFYENKLFYFTPQWDFDSHKEAWNICYHEYLWENPPDGKPQFSDNSEELADILNKIKNFAIEIEFPGFAVVFQKACDILNGVCDFKNIDNYGTPLLELPEKNLRIFKAAEVADVFGAMGSWNDSPPYYAHEKGLGKEYEELSAELSRQVRLAILYAINEV